MDLEPIKEEREAAPKRKVYEVEFDAMAQEVIEGLIRKDIDHISSIFGVSVSSGRS